MTPLLPYPAPPLSDAAGGGRVFQVNTSPGGVPKRPLVEAEVGALGLGGDGVNHPKIHGGPERAVSLWSLELILALQAEGHPVFPGATGENLTLTGLDWASLAPGAVVEVGEGVRLEVTQYVTPCRTIAAYFRGRAFKRISQDRHPGWARLYTRVLAGGRVRTGDPVAVVPPA